jgi:hypothetical protein
VLIQQIIGAILAEFIACAFGFGPAKPRAVGVSLAGRLFPRAALLESLEIDHIAHARTPDPATRRRSDLWAGKTSSGGAQASSIVIQNPRAMLFDSIKNQVSLCENQTCSCDMSAQRR